MTFSSIQSYSVKGLLIRNHWQSEEEEYLKIRIDQYRERVKSNDITKG